MNFGLISIANYLTSATQSFKSLSAYPVNDSISLFQPLFLLSCLEERIREAAAIYEGLNFKSVASKRAIS